MQFTDRQQTDSLFYRLYRPTRCFTVCTDRTDRKIVSLLIKFNEMQFTDCQQTDLLFYNPYRLYRSSNCFTPSSTNRCIQLPDRQRIDYYFFSLTDRTDRMIDLTDCISASILDMSGMISKIILNLLFRARKLAELNFEAKLIMIIFHY